MEHSKNFQKVMDYFNQRLWTQERVYAIVNKWITPEEYTEITNKAYIDIPRD